MNQGVTSQPDCCQCGTCAAFCNNINLSPSEKLSHTDFAPTALHADACIHCKQNRCLRVCPVVTSKTDGDATWLGPTSKAAELCPENTHILIARAAIERTRDRGASGGVITALVECLLTKGITDKVLLVSRDKTKETWGQFIIADSVEQLAQTSSSVYTVVPFNETLKRCVEDSNHTYAVVGRPCQIRSIRRLTQQHPEFGRRLTVTISLFCAWSISNAGFDFLYELASCGSGGTVEQVAFREGSWPGKLRFTDTSFRDYYHPFYNPASSQGTYYYSLVTPFIPQTCKKCFDVLGARADISVGDPWNLGINPIETKGTSLVMLRSEAGKNIFDTATKNRFVKRGQSLSKAQLLQSQGTTIELKKSGVFLGPQMCVSDKMASRWFSWIARFHQSIVENFSSSRCKTMWCKWYGRLVWFVLRRRQDHNLYLAITREERKVSQ